jgi:hypothetical protein
MDWQTADREAEISGCITRLLDDQQCQTGIAAHARDTEVAALDVAHQAQRVQAVCAARIAEDKAEIRRLRAEIPTQR